MVLYGDVELFCAKFNTILGAHRRNKCYLIPARILRNIAIVVLVFSLVKPLIHTPELI